MIPELAATAHAFAVGDRFLDGLVGDFVEADWRATDPVGHDPRWVMGHLAATRRRLLALVGLDPGAEPWEAFFGRGTKPSDVPADVDPRVLVQAFHTAHQTLAGRLEAMTAADLARPLGRTLPDGTDTVGGAVCFLAWHEAYHLGQLGLLRRLAGKAGRA
jgi:hypothetical protein